MVYDHRTESIGANVKEQRMYFVYWREKSRGAVRERPVLSSEDRRTAFLHLRAHRQISLHGHYQRSKSPLQPT